MGRRSDIAVVHGLRFGSRARAALRQSRWRAGSVRSQYGRSCAALAKAGMGLSAFFIETAFAGAHAARRDEADQRAVPAQRERYMQPPPVIGRTGRMKPKFRHAVHSAFGPPQQGAASAP